MNPIFQAAQGIPVVESPYLVTTRTRVLSRWEKFRVWVESLADRAEIYYHYPRVARTVTEPSNKIVLMGGVFYCHPVMSQRLREMLRVTS
jgi:hypothetical protein